MKAFEHGWGLYGTIVSYFSVFLNHADWLLRGPSPSEGCLAFGFPFSSWWSLSLWYKMVLFHAKCLKVFQVIGMRADAP